MALDDYGALIASARNAAPDYATQQAQQQALKLRQAELRQQTQAAQAQIDEQKGWQSDLSTVLANPTAEGYAALIARHPKFADQAKKSWEVLDESRRTSDLQTGAEIYSAAASGKYDLAATLMERRIAADKAAGQPDDPTDAAILEALRNGSDVEKKAAMGMIGISLSAVTGPDKFASTLGELTKGDKPEIRSVEMGGSVAERDPVTGEWKETYRNPYFKDADGNIGQWEGGDPASGQGGSGSPTGPTRTDAKTVWERMVGPDGRGGIEGGTNPDGSFRTSPKGAVGPAQVMPATAPEAARLAGLQFDEARYRSDPAYNLALGKAYYAKQLQDFGDPVVAAAAYNAGPGRVRQALQKGGPDGWVDHLPDETRNYVKVVSGGNAAGATNFKIISKKTKDAPSGFRYTANGDLEPIPGGPADSKDKPRRMTPQEVQAEGLNPNVVYYRNKDGVPQAVSGQDTRTTAARPIPQAVENKAKPLIDARDSFQRLLGTWKKEYGGYTVTGGVSNWLQGKLGTGPKGQRDWWADFKSMDNQIRNDLFGSALTATEKAAYEATTIDPSMNPDQIKKNLTRRRKIVEQAVARTKNYLIKNRFDPEAVDALFAPLGGGDTPAAPVRVRSIQEAKKLAPGTLFVTPDGRTMRKR